MKKQFILILFLILLFFLVGCKKEEIQIATVETTEDTDDKEIVEETKSIEPEVAEEIPEEVKKEEPVSEEVIENTTVVTESTVTEINNTDEKEVEVTEEELDDNVKIVELQMLGEIMQFFPNPLTIKVGDTVRFVNNMDYLNKTTQISVFSYKSSQFRSDKLKYDEFFEYTFLEKGEFRYGALPYTALFKVGKIIVE